MDKLQKLLTLLFSTCLVSIPGNEATIKAYYEILKDENLEIIENNIKKIIKNSSFCGSRKIPPIKDLLEYKPENQEIAQAWQQFCEEIGDHYGKMSDWVYTLSKFLGRERVEYRTFQNEPFLKKEFENLYFELKNNKINLQIAPEKRKTLPIARNNIFLIKEVLPELNIAQS